MTARPALACPAGHQPGPGKPGRACPACRRDRVVAWVAAADLSLTGEQVAAAVDAVAGHPAVLRSLATALAAGQAGEALASGAPPAAGRLVTELISRGSTMFAPPACGTCGRAGWPLTRSGSAGVCSRCRNRELATACARCGTVRPVAGRTGGEPLCERCRRRERGHRPCGTCGKTAPVAVRGRGDGKDVCANCYRMPEAECTICGRRRECNFAGTRPVCVTCSPRSAAVCAHCGQDRPPAARWPEGPVCDTCYTTALRRRGTCGACGQQRRLVAPPGPEARICADCAGLPVTHACALCGTEDKLFEHGRCARCSLRHRASALTSGTPSAQDPPGVRAALSGVTEAIAAARTPYTALNWLRTGAAAAILADVAAGRTALTHQALDEHSHPRAADYLRHMLVAAGALPGRDEALARAERWSRGVIAAIDDPADRQLARAYLTWRVLRRLRQRSEASPGPRTPAGHARHQVRTVAAFLTWLRQHDLTTASCRQSDVETWLATSPSACDIRDFLTWAADRKHCTRLSIPGPQHRAGDAASPGQRWELIHRLLHDDTLDLTDRAAGTLLLLFGQHLSRTAVMTTSQIITAGNTVLIRFGQHEIPVPGNLGDILTQLIRTGRPHTATGSPAASQWLFPGGNPGQPITAARLGQRLRAIGIRAQPGRRAALIDLAAQLPAAVLADTLNLSPGTAVRWMHQAGADWNRYAADIARSMITNPDQ
jgi:hypothetical protein